MPLKMPVGFVNTFFALSSTRTQPCPNSCTTCFSHHIEMLLKRAQSEPRNVYEELDLLGFDPTLDGPGGGSRVGQWALQNCWLDFRPVQRSVSSDLLLPL